EPGHGWISFSTELTSSLRCSTATLIRSSRRYALSRRITTFKIATARHPTRIIERTLKNTKIISIFHRIAPQERLSFKNVFTALLFLPFHPAVVEPSEHQQGSFFSLIGPTTDSRFSVRNRSHVSP